VTTFLQTSRAGELVYYAARMVDATALVDPTVALYNAAGALLVAAMDATPGPSTTLSASVPAGGKSLTVTSETGFRVGETYVLEDDNGLVEYFTCSEVAVKTLGMRQPMINGFPSGATVQSRKLSVEIGDDVFPSPRIHCRAVWSYESNGSLRQEESIFHVARYNLDSNVTPEDILRRYPRAENHLASRQELGELIEDVWVNEVLSDFAINFRPDALIASESLRSALLERVVAAIVASNGDWEEFDRRMAVYKAALDRATVTQPIDTNADGSFDGRDQGEILHPWVIRVGRAG